ncbi:MAG: DUF6529 family protein [Pseudonocardia sediminis]
MPGARGPAGPAADGYDADRYLERHQGAPGPVDRYAAATGDPGSRPAGGRSTRQTDPYGDDLFTGHMAVGDPRDDPHTDPHGWEPVPADAAPARPRRRPQDGTGLSIPRQRGAAGETARDVEREQEPYPDGARPARRPERRTSSRPRTSARAAETVRPAGTARPTATSRREATARRDRPPRPAVSERARPAAPETTARAEPLADLMDLPGPRISTLVVPVAIGTLVAVALGVYAREHDPTGVAVNLAGFSGALAVKTWLATAAMALGLVQLWSALVVTGRIGRGATPLIHTLHRWSGRAAVLITVPVAVQCLIALGWSGATPRALAHSLFGCLFYGAFATKMLLLRRRGVPGWAMAVAGGLVFALLTGIWLTSAAWFFGTRGITF